MNSNPKDEIRINKISYKVYDVESQPGMSPIAGVGNSMCIGSNTFECGLKSFTRRVDIDIGDVIPMRKSTGRTVVPFSNRSLQVSRKALVTESESSDSSSESESDDGPKKDNNKSKRTNLLLSPICFRREEIQKSRFSLLIIHER
jgi:signal peptidase I